MTIEEDASEYMLIRRGGSGGKKFREGRRGKGEKGVEEAQVESNRE